MESAEKHSGSAAFTGDNHPVVSNLVAPSDGLPAHTFKDIARLTDPLIHPCTNNGDLG